MQIGKYSFGVGDRFGHQGKAQLAAFVEAKKLGVEISPVWNKSYREHSTIHTNPQDTRVEADEAVKSLNWDAPYYVDADHINMNNVDGFIAFSDFFTLDVADYIGKKAEDDAIQAFYKNNEKYLGALSIPGIDETFEITQEQLMGIGEKYLFAVQEAGRIYRHILETKGKDNMVIEVSMDETDEPQTPVEMFFILSAIAAEGIPAQTVAPKFTGRFNKGVDYVGNLEQFTKEFEQDLAVVSFAVKEFGMQENLKLSVHSGSDKFSIYEPIRKALRKFDAGLHLKTAGTTWLEELIGLAMAGGEGLELAKDVYRVAYDRFDELCKPYATVIDIDVEKLPAPSEVDEWDGDMYSESLRHDQSNPRYNLHFRQLLHVGYKVAAEKGDEYLGALKKFSDIVARNVTENILERHVKPLFLD